MFLYQITISISHILIASLHCPERGGNMQPQDPGLVSAEFRCVGAARRKRRQLRWRRRPKRKTERLSGKILLLAVLQFVFF